MRFLIFSFWQCGEVCVRVRGRDGEIGKIVSPTGPGHLDKVPNCPAVLCPFLNHLQKMEMFCQLQQSDSGGVHFLVETRLYPMKSGSHAKRGR